MNEYRRAVLILATIGLIAGLSAAIAIAVVGDTFGFPGSAAYRTYEIFNRAMAILIVLETSALVAFFLQQRNSLPGIDRSLAVIGIGAWIGMAIGTAAEFWLFSDLPYAVANMRSVSFSVFSLSSLIMGIVVFTLGLRMLLRRRLPSFYGIALMLYLPVDIILYVTGQSIFLAAALLAIAIAGPTLVRAAGSGFVQQQAG